MERHELPDGWVWTTLGEIHLDLSTSIAPEKTPDQLYELYSVPSFSEGMPEIVLGSQIGSSKRVVEEDTVLLSRINPRINRTWVVRSYSPWPKIASTEWILFSKREGIDPGYLCYFMRNSKFRDFLAMRASGVGGSLMRVKVSTLTEYPIPLPPLPEQQRIVAKIEALFRESRRTREALERIPPLLAQFRQSVLAAAFRGELTERDPDDEPASVLLERIRAERRRKWEENLRTHGKDPRRYSYKEPEPPDTSELPELPEGWEWVTSEQLAAPEKYSMAIGPFGSNLLASEYQSEGVPLIFVRSIRSGVFLGPDTRYVTHEKAEELRAHRVDPGDVLITKMGDPPGDACLYPENHPPAVTTSDGIKWRLSPILSERVYFVHAINSSVMRDQIIRITQGVAQQKISLGRFKTVAIPLAPLAEQHRIVAKIDALFAQADVIEAAVGTTRRRMEQLDQAVRARAFRGELVPQNPEDEPAEVLLQRIREERGGRKGI